MVSTEFIERALNDCLHDTDFLTLPNLRRGKVRNVYDLGDRLVIITTDRLSAFDRILAVIPFKGQVLNQVSAFWFEQTRDIVPNHVISVPDPNVTVAQKCRVIPLEMVVRGYLTGSTETSAWTLYSRGQRVICGNVLPEGLRKNQRLEHPIITPTTKSDVHDESITPEQAVSRGIVDRSTWDRLVQLAFALFERGTLICRQNGLILVDTKYEFGVAPDGQIVLIDEIHTPDSSRFWIAATYEERFERHEEPENIDKEFLRLWFREHCDPYRDKVLPLAPRELVVELSRRYIELYEMITGRKFAAENQISISDRIISNLRRAGILGN